ncbi:MAG: hypothetical protein WBC70_11765 [Candidatus Aminicenantales bacterium]
MSGEFLNSVCKVQLVDLIGTVQIDVLRDIPGGTDGERKAGSIIKCPRIHRRFKPDLPGSGSIVYAFEFIIGISARRDSGVIGKRELFFDIFQMPLERETCGRAAFGIESPARANLRRLGRAIVVSQVGETSKIDPVIEEF